MGQTILSANSGGGLPKRPTSTVSIILIVAAVLVGLWVLTSFMLGALHMPGYWNDVSLANKDVPELLHPPEGMKLKLFRHTGGSTFAGGTGRKEDIYSYEPVSAGNYYDNLFTKRGWITKDYFPNEPKIKNPSGYTSRAVHKTIDGHCVNARIEDTPESNATLISVTATDGSCR